MSNFIEIKIDDDIKYIVSAFLKATNVARRGDFDGTFRNQYTGFLAEAVLYKYFFGDYPIFITQNDNGIDFVLKGKNFDVKSSECNKQITDNYYYSLVLSQITSKSEAYIFTYINPDTSILTLAGWIDKKHILKIAKFVPKGTPKFRNDGTTFNMITDNLEIRIYDLLDIEYLK